MWMSILEHLFCLSSNIYIYIYLLRQKDDVSLSSKHESSAPLPSMTALVPSMADDHESHSHSHEEANAERRPSMAGGVVEAVVPRAAMSSTSSVTDSLQGQDTDVDRDHDAVAEGISEDGGYDSSDSSSDDDSEDEDDGAHDRANPEGELGDDLSAMMPVHSLTAINNSESGSIVNVPRGTFIIPDDQRSVASSVWSTEACTSVKSLRVQRDKKDEQQSSSSSSSSQMPSLIRQRNQASTHSQDGSVEDEQRMQQQKHGDSDTVSGIDTDMDALALLDMSSSPELRRAGTSNTRLRFIDDTEEDDARQSSKDAKIPRAESVTSEGSSSRSQHMEQVESCTDKSKDDDGDDIESQVDVDEEFVGGQSSNSPGKDNDVADEDSTKSDDDESIGDKSQTEDALQARINAMLLDSDSDDDSVDSGSDGGNSQV
jgi:hypothetical protein